jgi:hypothetical protein
MYKAAIFFTDFNSSAPTAKEMKNYFKNSTTLLYGNEKRKNKTFPLCEKLHLVLHAYDTFKLKIFDEKLTSHFSKTLYVFDDRVNPSHLLLKYGNFKMIRFKLDALIIDEMYQSSWGYGHLFRYKKGLENEVNYHDFLIEKNIGDESLYKSFPKFKKSVAEFAVGVDKAMVKIEKKAVALFKSEW